MDSQRIDYENIGFKCGLEIHVQLNTEKKLFCDCPNRRSMEFPIRLERRIRPSAGELGEVDPAALHEFLRGRKFSYGINRKTACLVELDEEPPHEINQQALEIALSIAKALKCIIPDEIQVMRKVVADGSAVSGFQRTALIGMNGVLETGMGDIGISNISLEEDSASLSGNEYRLDRLGVPLVEIGTKPKIKNPQHARQTAERIGMLLFENRVRGIGAIRQDLNVSVKGGARVEIKGVQELEMIETVINNEIKRQQALIEIKNELLKRKGLAAAGSDGKAKNVTEFFRKTKSDIIQKSLKEGGSVFSGVLKGFAGLMKKDCGRKTFGKELSSYAEVFGLGLMHNEMEKFPFLAEDFSKLRKEFAAGDKDVVFIVAGKNAENACKAVMKRAEQAIKGVPEETRAANPDGTSSYLRPLPGSARMYPETDIPSVRITKNNLAKIKPPKSAEEILRGLEKILPKQMAEQMLRSEYLYLFEELSRHYEPIIVANVFLSVIKDLKRKGVLIENVSEEDIEKIFSAEKSKIIAKESIPDIMEAVSKGTKIEEALKGIKKITEQELRVIIKNIFFKYPNLLRDKKISALMGELMKEVRGSIEGEKVMRILKEEMEKA